MGELPLTRLPCLCAVGHRPLFILASVGTTTRNCHTAIIEGWRSCLHVAKLFCDHCRTSFEMIAIQTTWNRSVTAATLQPRKGKHTQHPGLLSSLEPIESSFIKSAVHSTCYQVQWALTTIAPTRINFKAILLGQLHCMFAGRVLHWQGFLVIHF